ncbi:carotenoid biosynthesis protein [Hugenholtzia roseola]|uniref:carotenoid biosynthesis protein n=1 Tax=Hugenholtzia roseola TaxID=1002 RepID=UPI0003FD4AC4|nr:carotenoid biosynthesis protein [Hugenholtzia roseola]
MIFEKIEKKHQLFYTNFKLSEKWATKFQALILVMHLAGAMGLAWEVSRPFFTWATPFNLLFASSILFLFHQKWEQKFFLFSLLCFSTGYAVEVLGVHTGLIFGTYWYGETLGFKILEVPLTIGLNWFVLTYCFNFLVSLIFNRLKNREDNLNKKLIVLKALFAASFMVGLDYWIEPIAIRYDFWQWSENIVPLQNYIAWWIVSFFLSYVYHKKEIQAKNLLALSLLFAQILFFVIGHFI